MSIITRLLCSCTVCLLILFNPLGVKAQDVYLCVWRNPERTMTKIFPTAKDYTTVNMQVSAQKREAIENELGFKLLAGQRDQFQYFKMMGENGVVLGTIIAASQKGEFGAIEFVVGFDTAHVITDLYIQRSREKDQLFKERSFLNVFNGVKISEVKKIKTLYTGTKTLGTQAVINGLVKEIVTYRILVLETRGK